MTDNVPTPLRRHLMAMHSIQDFDPAATEVSLTEFHAWDHETGEMGPPHDDDDLSLKGHKPRPAPVRKRVGHGR